MHIKIYMHLDVHNYEYTFTTLQLSATTKLSLYKQLCK